MNETESSHVQALVLRGARHCSLVPRSQVAPVVNAAKG